MGDTIELRELIHIILKRLWIIGLVTIMCIAVSGIISFFVLDNIYQADTTLMVSKSREDQSNVQMNDILLNQKLVKTYTQIINSDRILEKVIEKLDLDMTSKALRGKVAVSSVQDTEIIQIAVEDKNPNMATELANTIAVVFIGEIDSIMKMDNVQFLDPAKVPTGPIKPRRLMNIAIAGVLGMMLSVFIVFLIEYLDNTLKTPQQVEEHLGLPVLGSIPVFDD